MKKLKCYISGKITGLDEDVARDMFLIAEDHFFNAGYDVVNPMNLPHNHDKSWESYMLENLAELSKCTHIHFLPNWNDSPGARIEREWAIRIGLKQLIIVQ